MTFKRSVFLFLTIVICIKYVNGTDELYNSTKFSVNFYKSVADVQENQVLSPFSLRLLLAIVYQVSRGQTELELREQLYYSDKTTTIREQEKLLTNYGTSEEIKIITKAYVKNNVTVNDHFKEVVTKYRSAYENINFSDNFGAANKINSWVNEVSHGLIDTLVQPEHIKPRTSLLLANSLYFKAQWNKPFDDEYNEEDEFTTVNGEVIEISFMSGRVRCNSAILSNGQMLELKYTPNVAFSFWIMLPNKDVPLVDFIKTLDANIFTTIHNNFTEQNFDVFIPIFEIETLIDGVDELKKYGVSDIFELYEFDLLENDTGLRIDELKQKTLIRVNTNGTEACSAAYTTFVGRTMVQMFNANRPFVYAVVQKDTAEPIFIGHFSNPRKN